MYNHEPNWLVIKAKPANTKKVIQQLDRLGIQNYFPLNSYDYEFAEKRKRIRKPLFENWIFVRPTDEFALETLLKIPAVVSLLYWRDHPAIIPDAEIQAIKKMILEFPCVQLESSGIRPGAEVSVSQASMLVQEESELNVKTNVVKVTLPSLGYTLVAEMGEVRISILAAKTLG